MIVNLTGNNVHVCDAQGNALLVILASGQTARCLPIVHRKGCIGDIPLTWTDYSRVEGLPDQEEGVCLIVTPQVKRAFPWRTDLLIQAQLIRDSEGCIIGCQSLSMEDA
jgi:hypothetical protein